MNWYFKLVDTLLILSLLSRPLRLVNIYQYFLRFLNLCGLMWTMFSKILNKHWYFFYRSRDKLSILAKVTDINTFIDIGQNKKILTKNLYKKNIQKESMCWDLSKHVDTKFSNFRFFLNMLIPTLIPILIVRSMLSLDVGNDQYHVSENRDPHAYWRQTPATKCTTLVFFVNRKSSIFYLIC